MAADYVGKDAHDPPWKHQHTAPEYLEKRRVRRKSGGKVPGGYCLHCLLLLSLSLIYIYIYIGGVYWFMQGLVVCGC